MGLNRFSPGQRVRMTCTFNELPPHQGGFLNENPQGHLVGEGKVVLLAEGQLLNVFVDFGVNLPFLHNNMGDLPRRTGRWINDMYLRECDGELEWD